MSRGLGDVYKRQVKKYVPDTTLEFIKNNWSELQTRIKEGSIK